MSTPLEGIIPQPIDVTPQRFTKPGQGSTPMVRIAVGYVGAVKTLGFSYSATATTKMGQAHKEQSPTNSESMQQALQKAAGG
jgi:hypothetical protein